MHKMKILWTTDYFAPNPVSCEGGESPLSTATNAWEASQQNLPLGDAGDFSVSGLWQ